MVASARVSRRQLLAGAGAGAGAAWAASAHSGLAAAPTRLGVQLWMLRQSMALDMAGVFGAVAALGVSDVELAGAPDLAAPRLSAAFDVAGLSCVSVHLPVLQTTDAEFDRRLDFARSIGARDAIAAMPGFPGLLDLPPDQRLAALMAHRFTEEDWRWNAERLNELGARAARSDLGLAYHNHNFEFASVAEGSAFDLLIARTDPKLVRFQLDLGNAVLAGQDPAALLSRLRGRLASVHLKDWRGPLVATTTPYSPASAPFGQGVIDWAALQSAFAKAGVATAFIEQENLPREQELAGAAQGLDFFHRLARSNQRSKS